MCVPIYIIHCHIWVTRYNTPTGFFNVAHDLSLSLNYSLSLLFKIIIFQETPPT